MGPSFVRGAILALFAATPSLAHGGRYLGPGDPVPPPGGWPQVCGITDRRLSPSEIAARAEAEARAREESIRQWEEQLQTWQFWWELNKEPYLERRRSELHPEQRHTPEQVQGEVLPALLWVVENETENDLVTGAMIAAARIARSLGPDERARWIEAITPRLASPERAVSERATLALGLLEDARATPTLLALLNDTYEGKQLCEGPVNFRVRSFAAHGLGALAHAAPANADRRLIARALVELLNGPEMPLPDIKIGAMMALGLTRIDWTDERGTFDRTEPAAVHVADRVRLLAHLRDELGAPGPDRTYCAEDHRIRAQIPITVARLLGASRDVPAENARAQAVRRGLIERLIALSVDPWENVEVRRSATIALGMLGDAGADPTSERIFTALVRIAGAASDPQQRSFALMALAQSGARAGVGDSPRALQRRAEGILMSVLRNGEPGIAAWAALALGVHGSALGESGVSVRAEVLKALREGLQDRSDPPGQGACAIALGLIGDQESEALLWQTVDSNGAGRDELRGYACVALGLMGATDAVDPMLELARGSKFRATLLMHVSTALGVLADETSADALVELLANARGSFSQASIAMALGRIGGRDTISALVEMMLEGSNDGRPEPGRGFASAALGMICDDDPGSWNTKLAVNTNYRASVRTLTNPATGDGILDIL